MGSQVVIARRATGEGRHHDEAGQRENPDIEHLFISLELDALVAWQSTLIADQSIIRAHHELTVTEEQLARVF
jgi:hypothetical protein